ncbi:MAG TPA: glycosyltransferase family 39 protein [Tepidisphaeraceae bacterium]|nr:glycosyltransferase family 39 protein [Tepidisphaeraceae bacterium]
MTLAATSQTTSPSHITSRRSWWIVTWLAVAAAIFIRCWHLGSKSLWFDEGYTAWLVSHPVGEIIRLIRADTAPPLYYVLVHGWTAIFGRSEIALRSLSTVFSILTLLLAIDIARRLLTNPAAVAAAACAMGLSFMQLWYAQEARAYAMMTFLIIAAFDCLLRHLAARHRRWLILLPILFAAAMYCHNMMAPYVLALLLAWLVLPSEHPLPRRIGEIAVVTFVAGLLYLPWAIGGLPAQMQMIRRGFWADPLKHGAVFSDVASLTGVQHYWSAANVFDRIHIRILDGRGPILMTMILLGASGMLSIVFQQGRRRREAIGLLIVALFPPFFVAIYSVLRTPLFIDKLFLPSATLMPIFALLPLAMPLSRALFRAAWAGAAVLLFLSATTLYGYHNEGKKEQWRDVAGVVSQLPPTHRLIIFVANDGQLPFDYYYHYRPGDEVTGVPGDFFDLNPPRTMRRAMSPEDLAPLRSRLDTHHYDQIVLLLAHQFWGDPHHLTRALIGERFSLAGHLEFYDVTVEWYQSNPTTRINTTQIKR